MSSQGHGSAMHDPEAATSDRWVSVSALGEYEFCRRAGQLAVENPEERPRRGFFRTRPRDFYDLEDLRRVRAECLLRVVASGMMLAGGMACWALLRRANVLFQVKAVIFLTTAAGVVWLVRTLMTLVPTLVAIRRATAARDAVPAPRHRPGVRVNWWDLLQGGLESVRPREPLRDPRWRLMGSPWRILESGQHKFPAFSIKLRLRKQYTGQYKVNGDEIYAWVKDYRLFGQHWVRMAAYAHLLEVCEGAVSPYGIVVFGRTYDAETIPIGAREYGRLRETLSRFRQQLRRANLEDVSFPGRPRSLHACRRCPWGAPRKRRMWGWRRSACGERFDWTPPYEPAR